MAERLTVRLWQAWATVLLVGTMATGLGCAKAPAVAGVGLPAAGTATLAAARTHMKVPHRFQGDTASCGPSALWSVMSYHLGSGRVNFANLDKSLRPTSGNMNNNIGTMPGALAKAAARYHLAATVSNKNSTRQLRAMIDNGLPVVILGEWTDGKESDLHFVVVNGYEGRTNDDTTWIVTDSLEESGKELRWSTKALMAFWDDIQLYGRTMPYQRAMVNIAPKAQADVLPEDNRTAWVKFIDGTLKNATDVLRWLSFGGNGEAPAGWVTPADSRR
jgi:hypothetical protein